MSAIASRYARAFADVMLENHLDRDQTGRELELFAELIECSPELRTIWENPSVPAPQKRRVLDWIVGRSGASQMVRNLIAVLIDRHRISRLPEVIHEVELELNKRIRLRTRFDSPALLKDGEERVS
jgi:F-type H+-transporting ATPase subunit delta